MFTMTSLFSGYGHVYPNTELGRGLCIVCALLGIPLTLIFLGAVGDKMIHVALRIGRLKWSSRSEGLNKLINAAVIVLTGMVVMFLLPSVVFHLVEDWSYGRALYYSFITLSTIGFGDDVAGQSVEFFSSIVSSCCCCSHYDVMNECLSSGCHDNDGVTMAVRVGNYQFCDMSAFAMKLIKWLFYGKFIYKL